MKVKIVCRNNLKQSGNADKCCMKSGVDEQSAANNSCCPAAETSLPGASARKNKLSDKGNDVLAYLMKDYSLELPLSGHLEFGGIDAAENVIIYLVLG